MPHITRTAVNPVVSPRTPAAPERASTASAGPGASRTQAVATSGDTFEAHRVDGTAWCKKTIADLKDRTARGEKCRVVFDIDDTLADTRGRTLALAKAFDKQRGTKAFAKLTLSKVGKSAKDTCAALGLDEKTTKAFTGYWNANFFAGGSFDKDLPIARTIELAKQAKAAGAEVVYLTGRTETAREGTRAQLQRLGLPDADDAHLVLKPKASVKTAEWKSGLMAQWAGESRIGWFLTESRRDVAQIQADHPELPCVLLDNPFEKGGTPVRSDTPVLPSAIRVSKGAAEPA